MNVSRWQLLTVMCIQQLLGLAKPAIAVGGLIELRHVKQLVNILFFTVIM
jgi:hypothetical protein